MKILTAGMREVLASVGPKEVSKARKVLAKQAMTSARLTPGKAATLRHAAMVVDVFENGPGATLSLMALAPPMTFVEHAMRMEACKQMNGGTVGEVAS
jgi:hypothetical protein